MNGPLKGHLSLLLANLIYGANYTVAKQVMPSFIQPFGFVLLRVLGALVLFWTVSIFVKEKLKPQHFKKVALLGLVGVAINQLLFFGGLNITTPLNASIIMISNPIVVMIFAAIFLKERITTLRTLGIVCGLTGAAMILLFKGNFTLGSGTIKGDIMVLVNSMSWACYIVIAKPLMKEYNTVTIVKWVFLFGSFYVAPFGFSQLGEVNWKEMNSNIFWCLAFVVVCTTFVAYLLNTYALKELSANVVSVYIYLQPFLSAVFAIYIAPLIWGGEARDRVDAVKILSALLIFLGVFLVSYRGSTTRGKIS